MLFQSFPINVVQRAELTLLTRTVLVALDLRIMVIFSPTSVLDTSVLLPVCKLLWTFLLLLFRVLLLVLTFLRLDLSLIWLARR